MTAASASPAMAEARRGEVVPFLAEAALVLVSVVTVLSLGRLFDQRTWLAPLLTLVLIAHAMAIVLRRTRLSPAIVLLLAVVGGVVALGVLRYRDTTILGIPTWDTITTGRADLIGAWRQFGEVVAPAPVYPGFVLAAGLALWVAVWVADWAAFRLASSVEAVLAPAAIFLFVSLLGEDSDRTLTTVAFIGAALAFILLHRVSEQITSATWVGDGRRQGPPAVVAVGLGMVAIALAFGGVAGPRAPGVGADPMIDWHGSGAGDGTRVTVSPLVDIRKRLVDQSDVEAFTVRASRPAYWRLTSLDLFSGSLWSSSGNFDKAAGELDATPEGGRSRTIVQDVKVSGLDAIWLPAAYQPVSVQSDGTHVLYDPQSSTLIVGRDSDNSDGISYRVTSQVQDFSLSLLDHNDGAPVPLSIRQRYLQMPDDFPQNVAAKAAQIMHPGHNPYEQARLLQDWFRKNFTYDLTGTAAGHSDRAIEDFLISKRGYCEQFAGTFAAMARSFGLPARVAVGFTPGESDPRSDGTRYIVRGRNAHAWPEVYIAQAGWVPFEPTPGRGAPGAQAWTGVAPAQDEHESTPTTSGPTTTAQTIPTSSIPPGGTRPPDGGLETTGGSSSSSGGPASPIERAFVVALLAVAVVALYVGLLAGGRRLRTRVRRQRATTDAAKVRVAWLEGAEAVGRIAPSLRPAETHVEFAARVRPVVGPAWRPLARLAGLATATEWSDEAVAPATVGDAQELSREVDREVREGLELRQKLVALIDPRELLRRLGA
ncbi:MAG: transglutaminase domain-containing protein [Acidimicrobiia bacterium]|nr:transglutaminase domain-containing protein [Acidimicrobiia bacterium]